MFVLCERSCDCLLIFDLSIIIQLYMANIPLNVCSICYATGIHGEHFGKCLFLFYVSGIHGEHSESEGGVYDISNKRRMGLTEIEAVQEMRRGVEKIIELEKRLSGKK